MSPAVSLYRWDELALEKVTEMISRKIITGEREMLAQIYLKKGAVVPMHNHESEQITYVLQGAVKSCTSRPGSSTRPRRSTTPSSSTSSPRSARTGSITPTRISTGSSVQL